MQKQEGSYSEGFAIKTSLYEAATGAGYILASSCKIACEGFPGLQDLGLNIGFVIRSPHTPYTIYLRGR